MGGRGILVAGFGNELVPGDDCGLRVVEEARLPEGVDRRLLGRGVQALIHLLPGYDVVVLVDASRRIAGGAVRVVEVSVEDCGLDRLQSLHEAGLLEAACMALEVAEALGRRPRVYLVECGVGGGDEERVIREAVGIVERLVEELEGEDRRGAGEETRGDD